MNAKPNIKKTFAATLCAALLAAGAAFAQPHPHGKAGMHDMAGMEAHLAAALSLTADQQTQVKALHEQLKAQMTPLLAQSRQQHQELKSLVNGTNPDATEVGQKTLAANQTRAQIKALHENFKAKLTAILTPDQKAKLAQMEQNRHEHWGHGPGPDGAAPPQGN
jgi:Spy/CpxP family protein refolding chaperone